MKQRKTPLYDALLKWKKKQPVSFHVPGHKSGHVFPQKARDIYEKMLTIDATEISGLDDLHEAKGAILQAEQLTAEWYGSERSYFLVGGTTAGNLAMILATCADEDTVLVQRNSHQSIMNGLEMANAKPVFLTPFVHEETGVAVGITLETVQQAYANYPEAKALIVTNPNYYGMTIDLTEIIAFARERGLAVLVDEAHGAHFGIGEPFPNSALSLGADVVVQSAHKTLPALTMGSYLHVNASFPYKERLEKYLAMIQSSSPSYPIMASLDLARFYLAHFSEADRYETINTIAVFRSALQRIASLHVPHVHSQLFLQDPLKVVVQSTTGLDGYTLQRQFEKKAIFTELADPLNVLFVMPLAPMDNVDEIVQLIEKALIKQEVSYERGVKRTDTFQREMLYSPLVRSYKSMASGTVQALSFHQAIGYVAAEAVIPYPPGIPLLLKGERVTREHIATLEQLLATDARFHGGTRLRERQLLILQ